MRRTLSVLMCVIPLAALGCGGGSPAAKAPPGSLAAPPQPTAAAPAKGEEPPAPDPVKDPNHGYAAPSAKQPPMPEPAPQLDKVSAADVQKFQGTWKLVSLEQDTQNGVQKGVPPTTITFKGDRYTLVMRGQSTAGTFHVDANKMPKTIDVFLTDENGQKLALAGIYEISDKEQRACFAQPNRPRPIAFEVKPGSGMSLYVFQRDTSTPAKPQ